MIEVGKQDACSWLRAGDAWLLVVSHDHAQLAQATAPAVAVSVNSAQEWRARWRHEGKWEELPRTWVTMGSAQVAVLLHARERLGPEHQDPITRELARLGMI